MKIDLCIISNEVYNSCRECLVECVLSEKYKRKTDEYNTRQM